jgi:hypothetical protein
MPKLIGYRFVAQGDRPGDKALPFRNRAPVHAEATVVNSLIVTRAGGTAPDLAIRTVAGLDNLPVAVFASPPAAMR